VQDAQSTQAGLLQLSGTEQELFSQAMSYVPPAAATAAQMSEVAQVSQDCIPRLNNTLL
jgi:hypothetical protein